MTAFQRGRRTNLLALFENVKNTTKCTTGCGGYDKLICIISDVVANGEAQ